MNASWIKLEHVERWALGGWVTECGASRVRTRTARVPQGRGPSIICKGCVGTREPREPHGQRGSTTSTQQRHKRGPARPRWVSWSGASSSFFQLLPVLGPFASMHSNAADSL